MSSKQNTLFSFLLCFVFGATFATDFGNRTVTQYEPYLEWQVTNVDYSGNPYDVVAKVTYNHNSSSARHEIEMFYDGNDTWKFRFSGSQRGGWTFTTSSSNSDLNGHTGTITVTQNNDPKIKGYLTQTGPNSSVKWAWSEGNKPIVPNYDMFTHPREYYNNNNKINQSIARVIDKHGFTGFHLDNVGGYWFDMDRNDPGNGGKNYNRTYNSDENPDRRTFEAIETLLAKTYKAGGAVHFWMWGDSDRNQNLTKTPYWIHGVCREKNHQICSR